MTEYYLLKYEDGKVTVRQVDKDRHGHWWEFGKVELYDLPIPEIRMAIDVQAVVEKYRSER